jgi:hypothetical protein
MVLAIEADGASYRQSGSVRDRDRLRGEHLQRLGWRYHRLWSTNWFQNPDAEVAKVQAAYQRAVAGAAPDAGRSWAGTSAAGDIMGGSPGDPADSGTGHGAGGRGEIVGERSAAERASGDGTGSGRSAPDGSGGGKMPASAMGALDSGRSRPGQLALAPSTPAESPADQSPAAESPSAESAAARPLPAAQSGPVPLPAAASERQAGGAPSGQRAREPVRLTLPARRDRT